VRLSAKAGEGLGGEREREKRGPGLPFYLFSWASMYIRLETIPESNPRIMRHEAELQELKMTPIRP
jgi:hypothetical protein